MKLFGFPRSLTILSALALAGAVGGCTTAGTQTISCVQGTSGAGLTSLTCTTTRNSALVLTAPTTGL